MPFIRTERTCGTYVPPIGLRLTDARLKHHPAVSDKCRTEWRANDTVAHPVPEASHLSRYFGEIPVQAAQRLGGSGALGPINGASLPAVRDRLKVSGATHDLMPNTRQVLDPSAPDKNP